MPILVPCEKSFLDDVTDPKSCKELCHQDDLCLQPHFDFENDFCYHELVCEQDYHYEGAQKSCENVTLNFDNLEECKEACANKGQHCKEAYMDQAGHCVHIKVKSKANSYLKLTFIFDSALNTLWTILYLMNQQQCHQKSIAKRGQLRKSTTEKLVKNCAKRTRIAKIIVWNPVNAIIR